MDETTKKQTARTETAKAAEAYRLAEAQDLLRSLVAEGVLVENPDGTFAFASDAQTEKED